MSSTGKGPQDEAHQRWAYAGQLLTGYHVSLQTTDGRWHEGIFEAMHPDGTVSMRWVKPMQDVAATAEQRAAQQVKKPIPRATFARDDVRQLLCRNVRMSHADVGPRTVDDVGTDAAIGRGKGGAVGRRLERWEAPSDAGPALGLEEDDGARWDQFEANKRLFNVTTTFKEDLYSTKYDPKASSITPQEAARIAAEIERDARGTSNPHMREERGLVVDDSQVDEEDKYSAVVRQPQLPAGVVAKASWRHVAGGPAAASSKPIAIANPRAETNRVRAALANTSRAGKGSSPYGTPKEDMLSTSPLIGDAKGMAALNLDPGRGAKVEPHLKKMYYDWKQQHKGEAEAAPSNGTPASATAPATEPAAAPAAGSAPTPAAAPAAPEPPVQPLRKTSSKLNPNAKPFTFNPNASAFVPGKLAGASNTSSVKAAPERAPSTSSTSSSVPAGRPGRPSSHGHPPSMESSMGMPYPMWPMGAALPPGGGSYFPQGARGYPGAMPYGSPPMPYGAGRGMVAPQGMVYMQPGGAMMVGSPVQPMMLMPMMVPPDVPEGGSSSGPPYHGH